MLFSSFSVSVVHTIPFVDDFINQISEDEIYMTLPDGLLDINWWVLE